MHVTFKGRISRGRLDFCEVEAVFTTYQDDRSVYIIEFSDGTSDQLTLSSWELVSTRAEYHVEN